MDEHTRPKHEAVEVEMSLEPPIIEAFELVENSIIKIHRERQSNM